MQEKARKRRPTGATEGKKFTSAMIPVETLRKLQDRKKESGKSIWFQIKEAIDNISN